MKKTDNEKTIENIKRFMANYDVIFVHSDKNIFAKIAKCMEKTK